MLTAMGDVMREAYKRGWITTRDGNISVLDPDRCGGRFYITPSAVRKNTIQVEDIVKYEVNNKDIKIKNLDDKPSIELDMHIFIHQNKDMKHGSVVHLHPTNCVAAMHAKIQLSDLATKFPELGRYTKVGKNVKIYEPGSIGLAEQTALRIKDVDIVGQIGHGVTAYAKNPWDAFEHIERLEHICEIVLKSGKY